MSTRTPAPLSATPEGTFRYASRFDEHQKNGFFNYSGQGLSLSSFGIGTYKGEVSEQADEAWAASIHLGLQSGVNVLDTAIRYRAMRSERVIGRVLKKFLGNGEVQRDEIFVSSKGGLVSIPEKEERHYYVEETLVRRRKISADRIYKSMHCLDVEFLEKEIETSLDNLELKKLDCYFLHNPELSLSLLGMEQFYHNLHQVFTMLEAQVESGNIAAYGIASWNGFRRREGDCWYIDIERLISIARAVAGEKHHFKYLELPLSVGMPFIYNNSITAPDGTKMPFLERTRALELDVFASASLYEGKLKELFNLQRLMGMAGVSDSEHNEGPVQISLPVSENSVIQLFEVLVASRNLGSLLETKITNLSGNRLATYPAALNVIRSLPEITCTLAGMEKVDYLAESLQLTKIPKIKLAQLRKFLASLSLSS